MQKGTPITDDDGLLTCWKIHFATLAQSQTSESESGDVGSKVAQMEAMSGFEDFLLDSPMTSEEIESRCELWLYLVSRARPIFRMRMR